jgi:hypothetical protein
MFEDTSRKTGAIIGFCALAELIDDDETPASGLV